MKNKNSERCTLCVVIHLLILCMLLPVLLGPVDASTSLSRGTRALLRPRGQRFQSCPLPQIENGRVTIRSRNRAAVFRCGKKFQLFGQKFSTCVRGHWTSPPPACVKPGCAQVSSITNGEILQNPQYKYAVMNFSCDPGYSLKGSPVIFCNGRTWNSTAPDCEVDDEASAVSCDFETDDACGWAQERNSGEGVRWFRRTGSTPSRQVGTGPLYDHTLGPGNDGYYLYIETSVPSGSNHIARIFSPVYSPELSQDACFTFWYHMYGFSTGSLKVYVKPNGVKIENIKPIFQKNGEQGDVWLEGFVNISKLEVPFQIVIEGVRGESFLSDIAFDDARLDNGTSCNRDSSMTTTEAATRLPSTHARQVIKNPQSCNGRCGESLNSVKTTTALMQPTTSKVPELIMCDCHVGCVDNNTCCSDFHTYCIRALDYSMPPLSVNTEPVIYNTNTKIVPVIVQSTSSEHALAFRTTAASLINTKKFSVNHSPVNTPLMRVSQGNISGHSYLITSLGEETHTTSQLNTDVHELLGESTIHEEATFRPTSRHKLPVATTSSPAPSDRHVFSQAVGVTNTSQSTRTTRHATTQATAKDSRTTIPHTTGTTTRPSIRATTRPTTRATTRPTTRATTRRTTRPTTRATTRRTTRPTTRATTRPTTRATTRPTTRATTRATTRPTTHATTRPTIPTTARTPIRLTTPTKAHKVPQAVTTHRSTTTSGTRLFTTLKTPGSTKIKDFLKPRVSAKMRSEKSTLPLAVAGMVVAILLCICGAVLAFIFVRRRRRRRHREDLFDDSDVRFLTADEILDFSLATPKEYRDDDV